MIKPHWETHLYGYAVALTLTGRLAWHPENLARYRQKVLTKERTEEEIQLCELDPWHFIKTGQLAQATGRAS